MTLHEMVLDLIHRDVEFRIEHRRNDGGYVYCAAKGVATRWGATIEDVVRLVHADIVASTPENVEEL